MTQPNIFEKVIDALNRCGCRYVVVGGLAVNLHGYQRFTSDIDVGIDLSPRASQLAIQAIFDLDFRPRVPILPEDFADLEKRNDWIVNKQAKVISFLHPEHQTFSVDIFIDPPLDRILESSYEARFLWLCQAYDFLKDTLPNKFATKSE